MLIKARYLKDGEPNGREYTFISDFNVRIGDVIAIGKANAVVTRLNVPEEEILPFRDKLKKIDKKVEDE